jgi:hypothetical protein
MCQYIFHVHDDLKAHFNSLTPVSPLLFASSPSLDTRFITEICRSILVRPHSWKDAHPDGHSRRKPWKKNACLPCHRDTGRGEREHFLPAPTVLSSPRSANSVTAPSIHRSPIDAKHLLQALNLPTAVKKRSRPQDAYRSAFDPLRRHLLRSSSFRHVRGRTSIVPYTSRTHGHTSPPKDLNYTLMTQQSYEPSNRHAFQASPNRELDCYSTSARTSRQQRRTCGPCLPTVKARARKAGV